MIGGNLHLLNNQFALSNEERATVKDGVILNGKCAVPYSLDTGSSHSYAVGKTNSAFHKSWKREALSHNGIPQPMVIHTLTGKVNAHEVAVSNFQVITPHGSVDVLNEPVYFVSTGEANEQDSSVISDCLIISDAVIKKCGIDVNAMFNEFSLATPVIDMAMPSRHDNFPECEAGTAVLAALANPIILEDNESLEKDLDLPIGITQDVELDAALAFSLIHI